MLPVVAGPEETRRQIVIYSFVLLPVALAPWVLGYAGMVYGASAFVLGAVFLGLALRLKVSATEAAAKMLFGYSVLYLFLIFAVLLVDQQLKWV